MRLSRNAGTALLLLLLAFPAASQGPSALPGVVVSEAAIKPFPLSAEALGNARANESVEIRPEITAAIVEISFEEGHSVDRGAVLVRLQDSEPLADLAAARAALVDSESQYRRASELFKTRVVSESQLEQLEAQRDADLAAVNAAEARLAQTVIRAPFAGQLGLRRVSLGSIVSPSTVITTRFQGRVTSIDTRVDPVSRTVTVRALLPNEDGHLLPGMFLTVTLLREDVFSLMIPEQAIVPERSRQFVFVVGADNTVERREIRTGRRRPGEVEVLEGLTSGERVITEGTQKVRPGDQIRIVEGVQR